MVSSDAEIENMLVPTTWEDRDTEIVVQSIIDKKMGLETVDKLG